MTNKKNKCVVGGGSFTQNPFTHTEETVIAIPPEDYKGTVSAWIIALVERGLWDGKNPGWHGDVIITKAQWREILEECES